MTDVEFIQAVKTMTGLRPEMMQRLIELSPKLSPEDRAQAISQLSLEHQKIVQESDQMLRMIDEGMKDMDRYTRTELPKITAKIEAAERKHAETILDDDVQAV